MVKKANPVTDMLMPWQKHFLEAPFSEKVRIIMAPRRVGRNLMAEALRKKKGMS